MAASKAAVSARIEAVLWLLCQPERIDVPAGPMTPHIFFQPLSSCLAYPGFSKQCEQQDNWHHEQYKSTLCEV